MLLLLSFSSLLMRSLFLSLLAAVMTTNPVGVGVDGDVAVLLSWLF